MINNLLFSGTQLVAFLTGTLGQAWYLVILNAFGVIAIACKIFEYQVAKRDNMFVLATFANVCWVLYFAFYGNLASALTCVINVIKMLIFVQRGKYAWADSIIWLIVFLIFQILVTVFTVSSWLDVFSVTAGFLGILAYFVVNQKTYRALSFVHMAVWVLNSVVNFYPIALISDSVSTISCGVAIYRYDIKNKIDKKDNGDTVRKIDN